MLMSVELKVVVEQIKTLYKDIDNYVAAEQELIENLACTVEHYEKHLK